MILKEDFYYPPADSYRKLHIYLPDDYASGNNTYPVMYFFDGHNLFFDQDATFGRSWRFLDYLHSWNKDLIFVGMECSHDGNARLYEYMPYPTNSKYLREAPCIGDATLQWIVNDIKPSIDSRFPTIPNRQCTAIGGSSMGGLMAFYGATAYNHVFSKAACVSSSFIFCPRTVLSALNHCNIDPDTRIYLSYGGLEVRGIKDPWAEDHSSYVYRCNKSVQNKLDRTGAATMLYFQKGGRHCEEDWEKQIPVFMPWLWQS